MSEAEHSDTIRHLFEQVRDLPFERRHRRLVELGADPLVIAEVDALLAADAATSAWIDAAVESGPGAAARTELGAGDLLGAWRLVREIGSGGMGAVYLAERADGHFDQHAAIKLIRGVPEAATFVHFARERQILATLQHPNIARLIDGGATPGNQPYLVMELVDGVPIDVHCRERGLGLVERLQLFRQVCAAVQFAHQRFIVHCDLKPSNVLVRADGTPVLLDFGIARALDHAPGSAERATSAWITPRYASPEQLRGEAVTTSCDVFSLGLILFELLAGRRARLDADDHTITLLGRAAVRPSDLAGDMPWHQRLRGDLDAIVQRATAALPANRYASAAALADDIERHLVHRPVVARAPTWPYRSARLLRRRWPAFAVAAGVLVLAGTFMWRVVAERDRALLAEHESAIQAATAERVSGFLISVFNVSNPKVSQQRSLSARDVLDQGATRIEDELGDQPRVKARLLDVLGTAYRHIGEPRRAAELLQRAADLYRDPAVGQPLAAAAVLSQLAVVMSNAKFAVADSEQAARESLRLREQHAPPDSPPIADALNTLGVVLEAADRPDEAEPLLLRALAIRRDAFGEQSLAVASTLHNLGLVAGSRNDHRGAIAWFEQSMAIKRDLVGERHPDYLISLDSHAKELGRSGQVERAIEQLKVNLALCIEVYGENNTHVATAHNELGSMLHDAGRFADAASQYRAALAVAASIPDATDLASLFPLNNLASAYEDMGDYAAAEPLFRQSLAMRRRVQGADDPPVLRAEYNLARLLIRAGRLEESRGLLDHVLARYRASLGSAHANTIKAELLDIDWQLQARHIDAAEQALARLLPRIGAADGPLHARATLLASRLAEARGDAATGLRSASEAWALARSAHGDQHPLVAEYGLAYARALDRAGRRDEAVAIVQPLSRMIADTFAAEAPVRRQLAVLRL